MLGSWQTWSYSLPMGRCSWTSHPSKNGSVTTPSTMNETSALNSIMIVKWTTTSWLILIRPLVAPPHGSLSPPRLHQNLSGVPILPLSTIMTLVMRLTTLTMVVTGKFWTLCYTTVMVFFHRKPQPRGLRTIWRIRQLWNGKLSKLLGDSQFETNPDARVDKVSMDDIDRFLVCLF